MALPTSPAGRWLARHRQRAAPPDRAAAAEESGAQAGAGSRVHRGVRGCPGTGRRRTGLAIETFPPTCPFTIEQVEDRILLARLMRAAVVTFPGSNCDRDLARRRGGRVGAAVRRVWHQDAELPPARRRRHARRLLLRRLPALRRHRRALAGHGRGGAAGRARRPVLGVCNGFQILSEAGLLPGRADPQRASCASSAATSSSRSSGARAPFTARLRRRPARSRSRSPTATAATSPTRRRSTRLEDEAGSPSATSTTPTARGATSPASSQPRAQRARPDAAPRARGRAAAAARPTASALLPLARSRRVG